MTSVRLRPERTLLAVVLVMAVCALPLALSSPWFTVVLLLPVAVAVWVVRARVAADEQQLEVCNGLAVRRVAWTDVEGFQVPERGPIRLLRTGHPPLRLTAITRRQLPELLAVAKRG